MLFVGGKTVVVDRSNCEAPVGLSISVSLTEYLRNERVFAQWLECDRHGGIDERDATA